MSGSLRASLTSLFPGTVLPDPFAPAPLAFGAYFDLLADPSAPGERREALAAECLRKRSLQIDGLRPVVLAAGSDPGVRNFDSAHYSAEDLSRLARWWDTEPGNAMDLVGLEAAQADVAKAQVHRALEVLRIALPELSSETRTLVREIVLARPGGSQRLSFSGASSFALWGAIAINCDAHAGWPSYLKTIVHEAAHLLLFAIAREGPLVSNDPSELVSSPLRDDPRPVDGIFHAAFVSAREALALDSCLALQDRDPSFEPDARAELEQLLAASVGAFWECRNQLDLHARLTPLGQAVLAGASAYVEHAFTVVSETVS